MSGSRYGDVTNIFDLGMEPKEFYFKLFVFMGTTACTFESNNNEKISTA